MDWAAAASAVGLLDNADPEPAQASNSGEVRADRLLTANSWPSSPCWPIAVRSIAALIACRTASWLVGQVVMFGIRTLVAPAFSQPMWWEGSLLTKFFCRPWMKLPVQSIWPENSAFVAAVFVVYAGKKTFFTGTGCQ